MDYFKVPIQNESFTLIPLNLTIGSPEWLQHIMEHEEASYYEHLNYNISNPFLSLVSELTSIYFMSDYLFLKNKLLEFERKFIQDCIKNQPNLLQESGLLNFFSDIICFLDEDSLNFEVFHVLSLISKTSSEASLFVLEEKIVEESITKFEFYGIETQKSCVMMFYSVFDQDVDVEESLLIQVFNLLSPHVTSTENSDLLVLIIAVFVQLASRHVATNLLFDYFYHVFEIRLEEAYKYSLKGIIFLDVDYEFVAEKVFDIAFLVVERSDCTVFICFLLKLIYSLEDRSFLIQFHLKFNWNALFKISNENYLSVFIDLLISIAEGNHSEIFVNKLSEKNVFENLLSAVDVAPFGVKKKIAFLFSIIIQQMSFAQSQDFCNEKTINVLCGVLFSTSFDESNFILQAIKNMVEMNPALLQDMDYPIHKFESSSEMNIESLSEVQQFIQY